MLSVNDAGSIESNSLKKLHTYWLVIYEAKIEEIFLQFWCGVKREISASPMINFTETPIWQASSYFVLLEVRSTMCIFEGHLHDSCNYDCRTYALQKKVQKKLRKICHQLQKVGLSIFCRYSVNEGSFIELHTAFQWQIFPAIRNWILVVMTQTEKLDNVALTGLTFLVLFDKKRSLIVWQKHAKIYQIFILTCEKDRSLRVLGKLWQPRCRKLANVFQEWCFIKFARLFGTVIFFHVHG